MASSADDFTYLVKVVVTSNAKQSQIDIAQSEVEQACGNAFRELVAEKLKVSSMGMKEKLQLLRDSQSKNPNSQALKYRNSLLQSEMLKVTSSPPRRCRLNRSTISYSSDVNKMLAAQSPTRTATKGLHQSNSTGNSTLTSLSLDKPQNSAVAGTATVATSTTATTTTATTTTTTTTTVATTTATEKATIKKSAEKASSEPSTEDIPKPSQHEKAQTEVAAADHLEKKRVNVGFIDESNEPEQNEKKVSFAACSAEPVEKHEPLHYPPTGSAKSTAAPKSCMKQASMSPETKALIREIVERLNNVLPKQFQVTNLGSDIKSGLPLIVFIEKEFNKRVPAETLFTQPESTDDMLINLTALFDFLKREHCLFQDYTPEKVIEGNETSNSKFIDIILKHFSIKHSEDITYSVSLGRRIEKIEHVKGINLSESFVLKKKEEPQKPVITEESDLFVRSSDPEKLRKIEKKVQKKRKNEEKKIKSREEKEKRKDTQKLQKQNIKQAEASSSQVAVARHSESQQTQTNKSDETKKVTLASTETEIADSELSASDVPKSTNDTLLQNSAEVSKSVKVKSPEPEPESKATKKKKKEEEKRRKEDEKKKKKEDEKKRKEEEKRKKEEEKRKKEEEKLKKKEKKKKGKESDKQEQDDSVPEGTFKYAGDEEVVNTLNIDEIQYGDDSDSSDADAFNIEETKPTTVTTTNSDDESSSAN